MDALMVACSNFFYLFFLTRAKAFKPPVMGAFLRSLNMLPVYRVRDGFSSVQKNNAIFEQCFEILRRKESILIFAEANHNLKRRIRPLSKGFTRIAFGAEEKNNWELGLQIIPVGINYDKHEKVRRKVNVAYGKPIPVRDFKELYEENDRAASNELKKRVSDSMKTLTMHVTNLNKYPLHKILLDDLEADRDQLIDPNLVNSRVKQINDKASEEDFAEAKEVDQLAHKHNVDLHELAFPVKWKLTDIIMLPVYLFSFVNNIIPYQPGRYLIQNVIKDRAFDASIKFLSGLVTFPFFYIVVAGILLLSGLTFLWAIAYLVISLLTAPAFIRAKELFTTSRGTQFEKSKPDIYQELKNRLKILKEKRDSFLSE